jgi:hypothetical protein
MATIPLLPQLRTIGVIRPLPVSTASPMSIDPNWMM